MCCPVHVHTLCTRVMQSSSRRPFLASRPRDPWPVGMLGFLDPRDGRPPASPPLFLPAAWSWRSCRVLRTSVTQERTID